MKWSTRKTLLFIIVSSSLLWILIVAAVLSDPLHYLMNAHEWYRLASYWDHARAWSWTLANFATFLSYIAIPAEIAQWKKAAPFHFFSVFSWLFIAFIFLCGMSHLVMVIVMPTGPWWAILWVYGPMSIVSLLTVGVLRRNRGMIVDLLQNLYGKYADVG